MMWRDVIDLVSAEEMDRGDNVFELDWTAKTVFANKKAVNRDEFYKAFANNLTPSVSFEIRSIEYSGEPKVEYDGIEYLVLRTYSRNGETTELVCQAADDVTTNLAMLRDTVEIWHNVLVENSMEEISPQATRMLTVPARIAYKGGGIESLEDAIETTETLSVTISYRSGITPEMFLMIGGRRYNIDLVEDPLNRHATLILQARRVVP